MVISLSMVFRDLSRAAGNRIDRQSEEFLSVKVIYPSQRVNYRQCLTNDFLRRNWPKDLCFLLDWTR
jgi:hypothetical protein